ncbi:MAG: LPP20 family lipoprotein [Cyclobacteriaceae bacterium]|nr:LPP20 family lipoprotein [Cyclobacteriaceae bacterium]
MKKLSYSSLILFALAGAVMIGCKGKEKLPKGETEINIPCSGSDYFTNNKFFRANSLGESMDLVASKKKAMDNARAELAASIQSTVKTVTDNYLVSREFNNKEELEERFEQLNRTIVNQTLSGIKTICEKQVKTDKGNFKTYVAIELSASDIVSKYNESLSKEERLKIDYDYEKFKETFDKEMEKMGNR